MTTNIQQHEESPKPRPRAAVSRKKSSTSTARATKSLRKSSKNQLKISPEQRHEMISVAAYFIAEKRGFENGNPADDWALAESQFDIAD